MLRFEEAGLAYQGPPVLSGLSFALPPGSFTWLTGPSGAGKSSLLRLMAASLPPSTGFVEVLGRDVARLSRADRPGLRRQIGQVHQEFRLLDHLSAFDNVALPLRMMATAEARIAQDVAEMLGWVGLAERMAERPSNLSGGEQQRVAVARAVIAGPRLLLADEPTGSLDFATGETVMRLMFELNREEGTTLVLVTHDRAIAARCDRQLRIEAGRLREEPRPAEPSAERSAVPAAVLG